MAEAPIYFGYNPPFFGGHQNILSKQSGDRIVKNDLRQLILTSIGERVMRPKWGTIIKKLLFELITDELIQEAEANINEMIGLYEPRVSVHATVLPVPTNNLLRIVISGHYTDNPRRPLDFEVQIPLGTRDG